MLDDHGVSQWAARGLGALLGVIASMMIIAPEGTRNAFYRLWVGLTMGAVFSPVLRGVSWLSGDDLDFVLARAALVGVVIWMVLEGLTRFLSNTDWLVRLAQEVLRLRSGGGGK